MMDHYVIQLQKKEPGWSWTVLRLDTDTDEAPIDGGWAASLSRVFTQVLSSVKMMGATR